MNSDLQTSNEAESRRAWVQFACAILSACRVDVETASIGEAADSMLAEYHKRWPVEES